MITNAFLLAGLSVLGGWLVIKKVPERIKRWILDRTLLTDLITFIVIYIIFTGTLTALLSAAIAGIIVSVLLWIRKNTRIMNIWNKIIEPRIKQTIEIIEKWTNENIPQT